MRFDELFWLYTLFWKGCASNTLDHSARLRCARALQRESGFSVKANRQTVSISSTHWFFVTRYILEPLALAAMIAAQMAFTYVAFMNEAFHSALDAAAWLLVSAVALAASLLVGFEKRVRGQDEKNQAAGPNNRPMPQPSQR